MAKHDTQVNIRIPLELKERIDAVRAESERSFTAEVVRRLEGSFAKDDEVADLREQLKTAKGASSVMMVLTRYVAFFLMEASDRVPRTDQLTADLFGKIREFSNALAHGDLDGSLPAIADIAQMRQRLPPHVLAESDAWAAEQKKEFGLTSLTTLDVAQANAAGDVMPPRLANAKSAEKKPSRRKGQ